MACLQPVGLSRPRTLLCCNLTDQQEAPREPLRSAPAAPLCSLLTSGSAAAGRTLPLAAAGHWGARSWERKPRDLSVAPPLPVTPGAVAVAREGPAEGGRRRRLQHRGERPRAPPPGRRRRPRLGAELPRILRGKGPDSSSGESPSRPVCQAACYGVKTCLVHDLFRLTSLGLKSIPRKPPSLNDNGFRNRTLNYSLTLHRFLI